MPPSMEELKKRLENRKTESQEKILARFKTAYQEINEVTKYNYVVVNDDLENAVNKVESILISEKCRVDRIEEVFTVKVKKSLNPEIEEGKSYEFTFASIGNSKKEDIESIFTNHKLLSIIATDKEGLEQVNESVCE